jgi:hypothetical protein
MKSKPAFLIALLATAGVSLAQNAPLEGIAETTDPARIADIERRAQELGAQAPPAQDTGSGERHKKHKKHGKHHGGHKEAPDGPKG